MSHAKRTGGLGRNLQALLGTQEEPNLVLKRKEQDAFQMIAIGKLQPGRYQPRQAFTQASLDELAESIKNQGVIQPIVVRDGDGGQYEIVAGERRWRAAKLAELNEVPVIIKTLSEQDAMAIALIENLQREDLNPIEQAQALKRLQDTFSLTQEALAQTIGKSRTGIANMLRLLSLEFPVRALLESQELEIGHAKVLLALSGEQQIQAAMHVATEHLTVRQTEQFVQTILSGVNVEQSIESHARNDSQTRSTSDTSEQRKRALEVMDHLGFPVDIKQSKRGKGKLTIHFSSQTELDALIELLIGE